VLYRVLFHYFDEFVAEYENRFEREYGYFRPVIQEVVEKYLDCGNPKCGFVRIRCGDCGSEFLLRIEEWGEWMREELILDTPHRQVVLTIPKMLRKHSSKLERMDYLEFIARVTSHIPDKGQVIIRYYGLFSNAHRGKIRKTEVDPSHRRPVIEDETSFKPSRGWAEMIRKVYEVDPLLCPKCHGQMSIISFIEEPKTIDRIIAHLKLTFEAERPPPPQIVQQELLKAAEEREEYF